MTTPKRKTERDHLTTIADLEKRIETQSRVIQVAAKDATLSHTAAAAAFQLAAGAEFLLAGGMPGAARQVLTAMQFVESEYQRLLAAPAAGAGESK